MSLTESKGSLYPLKYPWALEFWRKQQRVHWLPEEASFDSDVNDFKNVLNEPERNLVTHIMRLFTKSDEEIQSCYHKYYKNFFKATEVQMMLTAFENMETIHVYAYSMLLTTLGLPETEFQAFEEYDEMKAKLDWLHSFNPESPIDVAESMAAFSGATEGMSLFASFAMLMNFPRHNKLKGLGDIIAWSIRDESMHCEGIARLYHEYLREHPEIDRAVLSRRIKSVFEQAVANEDKFIDLAFEMGPIQGLTKEEMKQYIRFIADMRLNQLGEKPIYNVVKNPLPWLAEMINAPEFGNFFEVRVTEYSKAATKGNWDDAWD